MDVVEHGIEAYPDFGAAAGRGLLAGILGGAETPTGPPPAPRGPTPKDNPAEGG